MGEFLLRPTMIRAQRAQSRPEGDYAAAAAEVQESLTKFQKLCDG